MAFALATLGHEDQDGGSQLSPFQQRLPPPALLHRPSLLCLYQRSDFLEDLPHRWKKKHGISAEICSRTRDENPLASPTPPLWLFMTLGLVPVIDLCSPNFSPAKAITLLVSNGLLIMKLRLKVAARIARIPKPLDPPDPPDPLRLLVTSNTIMVFSRFLSSDSECDCSFDEWLGLVKLDPSFIDLVLIVSVELGSLMVAFVRFFAASCRIFLPTAVCMFLLLCHSLASLSPMCDASIGPSGENFIVFMRHPTAVCRFQYVITLTDLDVSVMEARFLLYSSLVIWRISLGSSSNLFLLDVKTITIKAAILATSTIEIRHLNVFTVSLSLVKLLNFRGVVNEPESILHDIFCLLGPFSSIFIIHVTCTAYVSAEFLFMSTLLEFDINSMDGGV